MTTINITPTTDLAPLNGVRVRIVRTSCGVPGVYTGTLEDPTHAPAHGDVAAMFRPDGQAGRTGLSLPYGATTVTILGEETV